MQVHKKSGNMDDNASRLTGNAAYWAKRLPRTFARKGTQFIEEQKPQEAPQRLVTTKVNGKFVRQTAESIQEAIRRRERQRADVVRVLSRVKRLTVADIIVVVSYLTDIPKEKIVSTRRERKVIDARMAVSVLAKFWGYSFSHIGRCLGRDHATIMYHWEHYGSNFEAQFIIEKATRMLRFEMRKK